MAEVLFSRGVPVRAQRAGGSPQPIETKALRLTIVREGRSPNEGGVGHGGAILSTSFLRLGGYSAVRLIRRTKVAVAL
ncbi:hypothetical protein EMEDMD4_530003 [Sinorhizobium medicae]|uniref:Uncharacterized protein n=1 Tax=Sinorhizobium medicae TaxID=110321 RepID=A0A508X2J2_9HYPH|nr:hypothetical protein EMEDMD4_530003 [Sinorhizobium medicae]